MMDSRLRLAEHFARKEMECHWCKCRALANERSRNSRHDYFPSLDGELTVSHDGSRVPYTSHDRVAQKGHEACDIFDGPIGAQDKKMMGQFFVYASIGAGRGPKINPASEFLTIAVLFKSFVQDHSLFLRHVKKMLCCSFPPLDCPPIERVVAKSKMLINVINTVHVLIVVVHSLWFDDRISFLTSFFAVLFWVCCVCQLVQKL